MACFIPQSEESCGRAPLGYYDGTKSFVVKVVLAARIFWILLGMSAMTYMDFFRGPKESGEYAPILYPYFGNETVILIEVFLFVSLYLVKEITLASTSISGRTASNLLGGSLIGMAILSGKKVKSF
jgi:hypothetical protein